MFFLTLLFKDPKISLNQGNVMCTQMEEITTKLDEAQNLQQSNQQMIQ